MSENDTCPICGQEYDHKLDESELPGDVDMSRGHLREDAEVCVKRISEDPITDYRHVYYVHLDKSAVSGISHPDTSRSLPDLTGGPRETGTDLKVRDPQLPGTKLGTATGIGKSDPFDPPAGLGSTRPQPLSKFDDDSDEDWPPLRINPKVDEDPVNPVCPDCLEEIVSVSNEHERRFVCGCDDLRRFEFQEDTTTPADDSSQITDD